MSKHAKISYRHPNGIQFVSKLPDGFDERTIIKEHPNEFAIIATHPEKNPIKISFLGGITEIQPSMESKTE